MKSQDWANPDETRKHIIDSLGALCNDLGLSYAYTETHFRITLPSVQEIKFWTATKKRRVFNWDAIPSSGEVEGLPDELPPTTTPLDEGEKPEDKDAER
jgi:hypothetical protein